jgi:hypothetical protein
MAQGHQTKQQAYGVDSHGERFPTSGFDQKIKTDKKE